MYVTGGFGSEPRVSLEEFEFEVRQPMIDAGQSDNIAVGRFLRIRLPPTCLDQGGRLLCRNLRINRGHDDERKAALPQA